MKKTIITLFCLAGVASAATTGTIDTTDSTLASYLDFTTSPSEATYGAVAEVKDGYGVIKDGCTMWSRNSVFGTVSTSAFTLSFDVRSFDKGDLVSVGAGTTDSNWDKVTLNTGDDGALALKFYHNTEGTTYSISTGLTSGTRTEWTTLTLVGDTMKLDGSDTVSKVVSLYVDGVYQDSLDMSTLSTAGWCNQNFDGFQFGNGFRGTGTCNKIAGSAEIDNVLFYKRALTATEVKALVVPEPTTATLSLLALAGLAARRRRR